MSTLYLILLIVAALCFGAAAVNVAARVNLLALGLLAWVCVPLIQRINGL